MSEDLNRRRHVRLEMTEDAIAMDASGAELGRVSQAGGGGITVEASSDTVMKRLKIGDKLRVTIVEPKSQTQNTIDMVVRNLLGRQIGLEFMTGDQGLA